MIRRRIWIPVLGLSLLAAAGAAATILPGKPESAPPEVRTADFKRGTGLPLPRFVSLKSSKINVRRGPGQDYDLAFTFARAGLPVEIIQEFDNWRKIRDADGEEGWVFHSMLSGRRTAVVAPWAGAAQIPARRTADPEAAVAAYLEPKVLTEVRECTGGWCLVGGETYAGWIEQEKLWGVYPDEEVDG